MRIEIMIDKEQKISQATLDALESKVEQRATRGVSAVVHDYAA